MAHGTWRGRGPKKRGEGRGEREGGGGEHVPSLHCHALDVPTFLCPASPRVVEEGGEAEGGGAPFQDSIRCVDGGLVCFVSSQ